MKLGLAINLNLWNLSQYFFQSEIKVRCQDIGGELKNDKTIRKICNV